jgi:tight adherence protein C
VLVPVLALVFLSCCLLFLGILRLLFQDRLLVAERLQRIKGGEKAPRLREELKQPLLARIGKPAWHRLSGFFTRRMSGEKREQFRRRLEAAGNPAGLEPGGFRLLQALLALLLGGAGAAWAAANGSAGKPLLLLSLAGMVVGALLPELFLEIKINERRRAVARSLPDALDLLTVSVDAGLGFDLSLVKVTERFRGVLSEELKRLLQEMKLGVPRREALQNLAKRTGEENLTSFVNSLVQAEHLGVSISNILRLQSAEMRRRRRQRAEELAMQAPVKMLFPLIFFIFPALFVVLLGPALIQILRHL